MFLFSSPPPAAAKLLTLVLVAILGGGLALTSVVRGALGGPRRAAPVSASRPLAADAWTEAASSPAAAADSAAVGDAPAGRTASGAARSAAAAAGPGSSSAAGAPRTAARLLSDAEFVYGPPDQGLDVSAMVAAAGGGLARYRGTSGGAQSGAALLQQVSQDHSISPRLLLALLEFEDDSAPGGAVSSWTDGAARPAGAGLDGRLGAMAASLARGYYGFKYRGLVRVALADRQEIAGPVDANAATFAVARYLAGSSPDAGEWQARLARFAAAFGAIAGGHVDPRQDLPPAGLAQPPLLLPWNEGDSWSYTGGPHGSWGIDSAWGAVDFAPPSRVGCGVAPEWVVAAAPGLVVRSEGGHVAVDMDGDGYEGTGWVISYFHMADQGRVAVGTAVEAGDPIGHPSCQGGRATGAHLHFMRRYNGEWLPADGGPSPLDLSGWAFQSFGAEYDGAMRHPDQGQRFAATSHVDGPMELASDNGPARRAALAAAWAPYRAADPAGTRLALAGPAAAVRGAGPGDGLEAASAAATPARPRPEPSSAASPAAASAGRWVGGPDAPSLGITLTLAGRSHHDTPFIVGLSQGGGTAAVLMGHSAATGEADSLVLPSHLEPGVYTLTVRAPGFLPAVAVNVPIGHGHVQVDLSASGLTPLVPGELTGDDRVTMADVWAWLGAWRSGQRQADVDGDGAAGLGDLRVVLANRGRR